MKRIALSLACLAFAAPAQAEPDTSETSAAPAAYSCNAGALQQGGLLLCTGQPGSVITMDGKPVAEVNEAGRASIGLTRDAPDSVTLVIPSPDGSVSETLSIAPRKDEYREISGLDCDKVDARTQAQKDHAGRSWVKKVDAFKTFHPGNGLSGDIVRPAEGVMSSPFGPTRKYIGVSSETGESCEKTSVHRGYDIATPTGTPLLAPADGTIILGDPDLYYEGGTIFLDHGQGLVSVFMHLSEVDVEPGDVVKAGDVIGKTGNTGRTTGPHLHWSVKWRNTAIEDRGGDFYIDPALLLEMSES